MRGGKAAALVAAGAAALLALTGAAANAATAPAESSTVTSTVPMHTAYAVSVTSTDAAAGTSRVLLTDGNTVTVPSGDVGLMLSAARNRANTVAPADSVSGNCGSSYVYLHEKSNGEPVKMTTGFSVKNDAVAYSWSVYISGPNYTYTAHFSGTLALDSSWNGSHTSTDNYAHGFWYADVNPDSYALLDTGAECDSGVPQTSVNL
jgi:hypothetical protein